MAYSQDNRLIAIDTPLGKDVLLLAGFSGTDSISRLFSFELEMISENHGISFEDIVGKNVTVSVVLSSGDKRYFNGIISRFAQGRGGGEKGGDPRFSCVPGNDGTMDVAADKDLGLPHFPESFGSRYRGKDPEGEQSFRLPGKATGELRQEGLLRTVPGDGLRFHFPFDGRGGDSLFFRT